jgi:hypothetical protein
MTSRSQRDILVRRVNFLWYPLALVPIVAVFFAAAYGYLPFFFGLIAFFGLVFWLFSLGFALYAALRRKTPKEPRQ